MNDLAETKKFFDDLMSGNYEVFDFSNPMRNVPTRTSYQMCIRDSTWNYRYDLIEQLTASVDPEGKATEFTYNLVGELASVTKPGDRRTDLQYDGNYNVTAISDAKGYIYQYTYDKITA